VRYVFALHFPVAGALNLPLENLVSPLSDFVQCAPRGRHVVCRKARAASAPVIIGHRHDRAAGLWPWSRAAMRAWM
jgi:hypothetical protein